MGIGKAGIVDSGLNTVVANVLTAQGNALLGVSTPKLELQDDGSHTNGFPECA